MFVLVGKIKNLTLSMHGATMKIKKTKAGLLNPLV